MAQTILLKRRTTDATAPTSSDLAVGEIAVNAFSGKLYVRKTNGTVAEISGSGGGGGDAGLIPSATFKRFEYTATNAQTTFSGNDNASQSLSYVAGNILVYLNGVLLDDSVDYVATNGTSVVLQDGATTSDLLTIISYNKNIGTGNTTIDTFSGNGSTTAFTLSTDPGTENNTRVYIDGIYQSKSNYSVSTTTLTFSTAPPSGTAIEVEIGNREVSTSGISEMSIAGDLTVDTNTLKVDSSNNRVGIGTASPSTALQVAGTVTATAFTGALTGNVTGNVSGSAGSATGNAATATALQNARTIHGVSFDGTANIDLTEVVQDTAGGMFSSNTETGITATYQDSDGTVDLVIDAAQTGITSLLATDIKIGEDDQTKIDFETADEIHFYAANAEQVYVADGIFGPQTDSDVDLGSSSVRWKDAYVDTLTTTGAVTIGGNLTVNGTTTTVNSTVTTVDDPIFTIGGDSAPGSDDNKDRGIEFRWHNGSAAKVGFFGYDDSASVFTFIPDATNSSEVFSGTAGNVSFGSITGTGLTIDTSTLVVDASNNRVGIGNASPDVSLDIGSYTDAIHVPVGTTAQRPGSPAAGYFRYNSTTSKFEGYTTEWGEIAGSGGGGSNTFTTDNFTGNGSATAFTLSQSISDEDNLIVFEEGIYQNKADYTLSGTTLTFDEAPANGRKITVFSVRAAVSGSNLNQNSFTGNGSTAAYTLSVAPVSENNTQVFLDGVYQHKNTYSVSGTTLTFDTNVPNGTAIEVMTFTQTDINVPVDNTITTAKIVDDAVTSAKIADDAVGNDQLASGLTLGGTTALTTLTASGTGTIGGNGTSGGVIISDGSVAIKTGTGSVAAVDFYCESNNAHRVRLKSPAHANFSGNPDVTLPNYSGTVVAVPSSGDMTIDAPADIILDADGGDIRLKDGGTEYATLSKSSDHLSITSSVTNANIIITPNGTGNVNVNTDVLAIQGTEGESASLALQADESDDAGDEWRFTTNTNQTLTIKNNISGSEVAHMTFTPHATVANSTVTIPGKVGIGTTSTTELLNMAAGSSNGAGIEMAGNGNTLGSTSMFVGQGSGTDGYIWQRANDKLLFGTNNTEKMRLSAGGHLGIGTALKANGSTAMDYPLTIDASDFSGNVLEAHRTSQGSLLVYMSSGGISYIDVGGQTPQLKIRTSGTDRVNIHESNGYVGLVGSSDVRLTLSSEGTEGTNSANWVRGNSAGMTCNAVTGGKCMWEIGGTEEMSLNSTRLHVNGSVQFSASATDANRYNVYWNSSNGGLIVVSSDQRLKKDFDYDLSGIETIKKLKPVRYTWKESEKRQLGFVAQEAITADEHLAWNDTEKDEWGLNGWEGYVAMLTKAVQELSAEVESLKEKLNG